MRIVTRFLFSLALLFPVDAMAQDDDPGFIARQIEKALTGPGREAHIEGFTGLLFGKSEIKKLTFSDETGTWFILEDAVLNWQRTALLRGRLKVDELSASNLAVLRKPIVPEESLVDEAPSATASGFKIPDLPVEILIDRIDIAEIQLGKPLLGRSATLKLDGHVTLGNGDGDLALDLVRLDGPAGRIALQLRNDAKTDVLSFSMEAKEDAQGLLAAVIGIPNDPSLDLSIVGKGPVTDFHAQLDLSTDGQERLGGKLVLAANEDGTQGFEADLSGDLRPLLDPQVHAFFGDKQHLKAKGGQQTDGTLDLTALEVKTQSLTLTGSGGLDADGQPSHFDLQGHIANPDGSRVRLPVSGDTTVQDIALKLDFDATQSDNWTFQFDMQTPDFDGTKLEKASIHGGGTLEKDGSNGLKVQADLKHHILGLQTDNTDLNAALGADISGVFQGAWSQQTGLELGKLTLGGPDYGIDISGKVDFADRTAHVLGKVSAEIQDLSRFSALAGRDLKGSVDVSLNANGDVLGGIFGAEVTADARDLGIGDETIDKLLVAPIQLVTSVKRDQTGTQLKTFKLTSTAINGSGSGKIGEVGSALDIELTLSDLGLILPDHPGAISIKGSVAEPAENRIDLDLNVTGPYDFTVKLDGEIGDAAKGALDLDISLPDLAPLTAKIAGAEYITGAVKVTGTARDAQDGLWAVDLLADLPFQTHAEVKGDVKDGATDINYRVTVPDLGKALPDLANLLSGALSSHGRVYQDKDAWIIGANLDAPKEIYATTTARITSDAMSAEYKANIKELSVLVPSLAGSASVDGNAARSGTGPWKIDTDLKGPWATTAALKAEISDTLMKAQILADVPNYGAISPSLSGSGQVSVDATQSGNAPWVISATGTAPWQTEFTANGQYGPETQRVQITARMPNIASVAPGMSGPVNVTAEAAEASGGYDLTATASGAGGLTANANGRYEQGASQVSLDLDLADIAALVPSLSGKVAAQANLQETGDGWTIGVTSQGPATATSQVNGTATSDFATMDLAISGIAPLALANDALSPRALGGDLRFDLTLKGAPGLESLSGIVETSNAGISDPILRMSFDDVSARIELANARANITARIAGGAGGNVEISGPLSLAGDLQADLRIALNSLILEDPALYTTELGGEISVTGPLATSGQISGRIDIGETEVQVPSGDTGFGGSIPEMDHVDESNASYQTRVRADAISEDDSDAAAGSGAVYNLDITINAPNQIFLRGRGLDMEMGGSMEVRGTSNEPLAEGGIEIIRGNLSILGKQLEFSDESKITLSGGLSPYLDFQATSDTGDYTIVISITGPVDDPDFEFTSEPGLPQDEVLSQFLFGTDISSLSALQAAQLAASLAELAGYGGGNGFGIRSALGLDTLNVATGEDGSTEVTAGRYLTDQIYTDVTSSSNGESTVNLNIDLSKAITITGSASNDGDTSLGIFFEKDY